MRTLNIVFGLMGLVGGTFGTLVGFPTLATLDAPVVLTVGVLVVAQVSSFVGIQTLLTGVFGSKEDQFSA